MAQAPKKKRTISEKDFRKGVGQLDLTMTVNRNGGWNEANHNFEVSMADKALPVRVFERDKYTCRSCGLSDSKTDSFMEIHHIDGDHEDNNMENLLTICPYCHMCFHIDYAGRKNHASPIFLPQLTQIEIFHLFRALKAYDYSIGRHGDMSGGVMMNGRKNFITEIFNFFNDKIKYVETVFGSRSLDDFAGVIRQYAEGTQTIIVDGGETTMKVPEDAQNADQGTVTFKGRTVTRNSEDILHGGLKYLRIMPNDRYYNDEGKDMFPDMVKGWAKYYETNPDIIETISAKLEQNKAINISSMLKKRERK